jgi:hypothetical protein
MWVLSSNYRNMKRLRTIIIIAGILVAGVAFSSVAQHKSENKTHKAHSIKHEHKNKSKGNKDFKAEMKAHKGGMKAHKKQHARRNDE